MQGGTPGTEGRIRMGDALQLEPRGNTGQPGLRVLVGRRTMARGSGHLHPAPRCRPRPRRFPGSGALCLGALRSVTLASRAFAFLSAEGRWPEAADIYIRLRDAARDRDDSQVVENCAWELSWIQDEGGEIRRPPAEIGRASRRGRSEI